MSHDDVPDEPQETVLHAVGCLTGEKPKVLLRDADSEEATAPNVDAEAQSSKLITRTACSPPR